MAVQTDEIQILPSAARTTAQQGADKFNGAPVADGIEVCLDLTSFVTAAALTLQIEEWVPTKGAYVVVLASPSITAVGTTFLRMFPGAVEVTNQSRNAFLPKRWRVSVAVGNANSCTYSVDAQVVRFWE